MPSEPYDMLVLAPGEFLGPLQALKAHKDRTGIATLLVGLPEVYREFAGRDEAEKVKNCLAAYCRQHGVRYAMLVGDGDKFPVRYTKSDREDPRVHNTVFYPTDLYYADLFEPDGSVDLWDPDQDGYFGEIQGGVDTGVLNMDEVDLRPDICVGRVPASTAEEVGTYVSKLIGYETGRFQPSWFKRALMVATTDWLPDACRTLERIAEDSLSGMAIRRLYAKGNPCRRNVSEPNPANINRIINDGVGFVSYIGHGYKDGWLGCYDAGDLRALVNESKLPVVFASACSTAEFAPEPPYRAYLDVHGVHHRGADSGEVFHAPPPPPACLQTASNPESLAEAMVVKREGGAIGYVGCVTGAQAWAVDLNRFFFEAFRRGHETLGGMWNYMVQRYYEAHVFPSVIEHPDWYTVCGFHQPWKFFLLGDPSLRVGGIRADLQEDCLAFDYRQAQILRDRGSWVVAAGNNLLLNFGYNLPAAIKALQVIRHYRLDRRCFVGRPDPSMEYFLSGGRAPLGPFRGEDAVGFNPSAATVKKIRGRWKIVDGEHWILDFGRSEQEALKAFRIIQKYGFNHVCFVGRPRARMTYFRR